MEIKYELSKDEYQLRLDKLELFISNLNSISSIEKRQEIVYQIKQDVYKHLSIFEKMFDAAFRINFIDLTSHEYSEYELTNLFFPEKFKAKYILEQANMFNIY